MSLPSFLQSLGLSSSDLSDHHSLKKDIISLNIAFVSLVVFVTGTRLSIRLLMVRAAGLDDWLMLLATLSTIILSIFSLLGAHHGLGTHIWLLTPFSSTSANPDPDLEILIPVFLSKIKHITQCLYGCYLSYATAITLLKASIIVSYLRIFPHRPLRLFMYGTLVLVVLMWICSVFIIIFECLPVAAAWDWTLKGRCINILSYFYVSSSINIMTDFILVLTPLPLFWAMNMHRPDRIMLCGLFGFGFFACIASILRLAQLHGLHSKDITYTSVPSLNWSVAEVSTAIMCACLPAMRPLAVALLPSLSSSFAYPATRSAARASGVLGSRQQSIVAGTELQTGTARSGGFFAGSDARDGQGERKGDWEEGEWAVLEEERGDEHVDMKDMLREGCVPKKYLETSPPPTPGEKRILVIE